MASILFGGGVSAARGSLGGNTFSRNRAGAHVRARTKGVRPATTSQTSIAAKHAANAQLYSYGLTSGELVNWRSFASANPVLNRFGQTMLLSGQQMFCRLNNVLTLVGSAPITSPPANLNVSQPTSVFLAAVHDPGGSLTVTVNVAAIGANEYAWLDVTYGMSAGRSFVSSQLRRIVYQYTLNAANAVEAEYRQIFGSLPRSAGVQLFVRAYVVNVATGAVANCRGARHGGAATSRPEVMKWRQTPPDEREWPRSGQRFGQISD